LGAIRTGDEILINRLILIRALKWIAVTTLVILIFQVLVTRSLESDVSFKRISEYVYINHEVNEFVGQVEEIKPQGKTVASASSEYPGFTEYDLYVKGSSSSAVVVVREYRLDENSRFSILSIK
jgi:hypothetical protein